MIVQEKKKAIKKPVLRFKMYKSGKQMINASFIGLSMVGVMTVTSTINANADANTNPPATVSQTSQASTTATPGSGSNTVTNQVTVNSSTLDNAVSAAKSAGLPVNTKPATSQTVQESQVPVARQQIESDYQSQAAKINSTVAEYNHAKSNYSTYNGAKGDNSALNAAVSNASTIPGLSVVKDSDHPTTSVSASSDDAIVSASAAIQSDYANQIKQISDAIATQKQNNKDYDAAYKDWQSKNAANEAKYQSQMADYRRKLEEYNQTINGKPTITSNGNTKLVGTTGTPGSIGYYSGMAVVTTDDGYTSLGQVSWNSNTSLIGTSKKASLTSKQGQVADGNLSDFYDITDVVRNNGSITLTNVAHDGYGINYDLKLTFTNTDTSSTGKVILGPANDGSIEFDFYGGYQSANAGLNISSMQFVYHGTNVAAPVLMNSLFSDLDVRQSFNTNLGNVIAWTPNNSHVSILGDNYVDNSSKDEDDQGFNSSPKGTGVMVGKGSNFYYHFYNGTHNGRPGGDITNPNVFDNGTQFNLFGKGASLAQSPTPPIPQSTPAPSRKTSSVHYHYDTMTVLPPDTKDFQTSAQYHNLYSQTDVNKHFTSGDQTTDNKLYIDGDNLSASVSVKLLGSSDYEGGLKTLEINDDYTNFANNVSYVSAKMLRDGQDVSTDWTFENKDGHVIATAKDPGQIVAGTYTLQPTWTINTDLASGTVLTNNGSVTVNDSTGKVPPVNVPVYKPTDDKHWVEGNSVVDNKTYINDDTVHGRINMSLPDPTQLANPLSEVSVTDDYSQAVKYLDYDSASVQENGKDVTDQYTITTSEGKVTATRKDPASTPAGNVTLLVNFTVKNDVPSGTKIVNGGSGTINHETVPTNKPEIVTYVPTDDKHWVEGSTIVDDHSFIAGDDVHGMVTMTLPNPDTLAKKLTNVSITDDFTNFTSMVDYQNATVYENGKDVTNQYTITVKDGKVTAVRKDASSTPGGSVQLNVTWTAHKGLANGTKFINQGSGSINNYTVETPKRTITTYTQNPEKHWVEGSTVVDNKLAINGDTISALVTGTLPDQSTLTKALHTVSLTDDFTNFADKADVKSITITENGKDASAQYDVVNKDGKITATRKNASEAPAGVVQMLIQWALHKDVANGTKLQNTSSELLNNNSVSTKTVTLNTFKPNPDKHWTEGNNIADNKVYVDGDTVHTDVTLPLPDPSQLAKPLSHVSVTDDYGKFAQYVKYLDATVYENGKDVTSDYDIINRNNQVIAVRKDASKAPAGTVDLHLNFEILATTPSGTDLLNNGFGQINDDTVPTPERKVTTYKTDVKKHWTLDNQVTDNEMYLSGTTATAQMTVNLPSNLAAPLSKFEINDDFTKYANDVTVDPSNVKISENGQDATSLYDIKVQDGHVIATRKDPASTPEGTAVMTTVFNIKNGVKTGTVFENNGSATVNTDTETVPPTKIVVWTPIPTKDVGLNEQNGKVTNSVNGKTIAIDSTGTFSLTSDPVPANRSQKITSRQFVDTLDAKAKYVGFKAFVEDNGKFTDVTDHIKLTQNGQTLTFSEDQTLLDRYNQDLTKEVSTPIIDVFFQAEGNGSDIKNTYDLITNGVKTTSNTVEVKTPNAPKPVKKDLNNEGVDIDGKNMLPGDVNKFEITADYSDYNGMEASDDDIAKGFYIIDDYPEEALNVDSKEFTAHDSKGEAVKGLTYKIYRSLSEAPEDVQQAVTKSGIKLNGAFIVASATDPAQYFKDYVQKGDSVTIDMPMTVKDAYNGEYKNSAYQFDFGHGYATNIVSNKVPKINPSKDVVISVDNQKSLNGANIALNQTFDYKLTGALLPANEGNPITQYGFQDDYDQEHDQYNGQYSVLLDTDVTFKDGTVLKKGTDVTKYTTQEIDTQNGAVDIEFDKDFLSRVDIDKGGFGASVYLNMKRVKAGDVTNKYTNIINGKKYVSNTVKTHTDEPKKPEPKPMPKPTPETPTPAKPEAQNPATPVVATITPAPAPAPKEEQPQQAALPQTGNEQNVAALTGLAGLLFGLGALGFRKKKRTA